LYYGVILFDSSSSEFLIRTTDELFIQNFIHSQNSLCGAPAHTARQAQDWLQHNCPNFIRKDEWPPNSPDLNPLDFCVWGMMLDKYEKHTPRPTKLCELKIVLQTIWNELPQNALQKAVLSFRKRLRACIRSDGGHFEHLLS